MFRCRLFPGQYLLLTRKQGEVFRIRWTASLKNSGAWISVR